ncbi:MAG: hypothetical protein KUG77_00275 [Nannocystaceae bacterium]|nr:hypothetical protein [Nannocystaceae bacterium]
MTACLSILGATACDLPDKNIGDETMGDSGAPGDDCEPGDDVPAADGCNTCTCQDDGALACTEIACGEQCEPGTSVPADDGCNTCECNDDGTIGGCTLIGCDPEPQCEPGTSVPAPDGCNTCECNDDGTIGGCTEIACDPDPQCEPGTSVPAADGCNTCECNDDGTVGACTAIGCEPADTDPFDGPELSSCAPSTPFDDLVINDVTLKGDILTLDVAYSGCGPGHPLGGCWNGNFNESAPVQTGLDIAHDDLAEECDAFPSDSFEIDLTPMREAYLEGYGGDSGEIDLSIPGWDESILYSF